MVWLLTGTVTVLVAWFGVVWIVARWFALHESNDPRK